MVHRHHQQQQQHTGVYFYLRTSSDISFPRTLGSIAAFQYGATIAGSYYLHIRTPCSPTAVKHQNKLQQLNIEIWFEQALADPLCASIPYTPFQNISSLKGLKLQMKVQVLPRSTRFKRWCGEALLMWQSVFLTRPTKCSGPFEVLRCPLASGHKQCLQSPL